MLKQYHYIGKASEGLTRVKDDTAPNLKCGFIDENGNVVIPLIYSNVRNFSNGFAAVKAGSWASNKWGYIDRHGELVIPLLYEQPRAFSCGLAKVVYNGEWYFINTLGQRVISLKEYDGGSRFHNGYAIVYKRKGICIEETTFGIINTCGEEVIPCKVECFRLQHFFCCSNLSEDVFKFS